MATVAATIADSGVHHDPYFVQRVTDATGRVIFDEATTNSGTQAISESAANCEMDVLRGVITHGTGGNARLAGGHIAFGKTGTTDARANAWFIGGTPHQLVAAVWHGAISGNVPGAGFGGNVAARLWARFMNSALAGQPNAEYPPPGPVCDRPGGRIGVDQTGWTRIAPNRPPSLFGPSTPTVVVNPIPTTATTSSGPGNSGHGGGPPGKK
ncbi:MAG: hypothetical protein E6G60_05350 [Actinobacteria bacterium]|nr:MAG: hypothetical protein E6G60_05350 [Actinomycetota bacterium]